MAHPLDDDDPLAAALFYAELGLRVVHAPKGEKHPAGVNAWQHVATTDVDTILQWWDATFPGANVSVVTGAGSGVFVIDVDEHDPAASGSDTLADLVATYGPLPPTPTVITPSGGTHVYFRLPAGVTIASEAGVRLGPGIDVRGEGGQVMAPPSVHPNGGRYTWDADLRPAELSLFAERKGTVDFAEPPAWLCELLTAPPPEREPRPKAAGSDRLPGQQWAQATDWGDLLTGDGAVYMGARRDHRSGTGYELWARPGIDGDHASASLGYRGSDVLKVFTSNWPGLTQGATYTKFGYFAATRHGGDFTAARATLEAEGYQTREVDLHALVAGNGQHEAEGGAGGHTGPDAGTLRVFPLAELLSADEPSYDWLVPSLIERGDRVIITGDEGYGKSTLLRQLGVGAAVGVNTLARSEVEAAHEPCRVLLIDCENSARQLRREFPKVLAAVSGVEAVGDRFHLAVRTDGLILDQPGDDRRWLVDVVGVTQPDLLLIGPLYKLLGGDPTMEAESRNLVLFLDALRGRDAAMAIALEAHAPHGQRRPYGWSGYKRWPEFGLHLTFDGALQPFRGGRDEGRYWPPQLRRGGESEWPWLAPAGPTGAGTVAPVLDIEAEYAAKVRQVTLRTLHDARRPLTMAETIERTGRRKAAVVAAVRYYQDAGWLLVTEVTVHGSDGRSRTVEAFAIDPTGPAGGI